MPRKWTKEETERYRNELQQLYVVDNLSMYEIAKKLKISAPNVHKRLKKLHFPSLRHLKKGYNNSSRKVIIPSKYNNNIAEFFGIMLGDGHISSNQIIVSLGNKEIDYVEHVSNIMQKVFKMEPSVFTRQESDSGGNRYKNVYFGSVAVVKWLLKEGLVHNKVKKQVDIPEWIFSKKGFMKSFLRGFFDTDGSIYKLKFGSQISFTNYSQPLLKSLQMMLIKLGYTPSRISVNKVYLTRNKDVRRFFKEIKPKNSKHQQRFIDFTKCVGTQVVNEGRL